MPDNLKQDALRLAAEVGADPRTAERWLAGGSVLRMTADALQAAADKLGIERPLFEASP